MESIIAIVFILFVLPLALVVWQGARSSGHNSLKTYLTNDGCNGYIATIAGAICGNVGIGSFIAIFLFTSQSPVIGFSIVGAYTFGLIFCAIMVPRIKQKAEKLGSVGLIDLISLSHNSQSKTAIWFPVAIVFIIRSAVQLAALGFLATQVFGGSQIMITLLVAGLIALYLVIGGYRAAVETDIIQSLVIVAVIALAIIGLPSLEGTGKPFFNFEPYKPAILVGIWLFIPFSAVLAVDNWQRITIASSTKVAQRSYLFAALVCGVIFLTIAYVGYWSQNTSVYESFESLLPSGYTWLANAMFIACIMSSIDTFIMPLASAVGQKWSMKQLRTLIVFLVFVTALAAILIGDVLTNIIAAFNSLVVFLPATFGALFLKNLNPAAATSSMWLGLLVACGFTLIDENIAALIGFLVASGVYGLVMIYAPRVTKTA